MSMAAMGPQLTTKNLKNILMKKNLGISNRQLYAI